jgi:hypothetical protein
MQEFDITLTIQGTKLNLWLTSSDPEEAEIIEAHDARTGEEVDPQTIPIQHLVEALYEWHHDRASERDVI